MEITDLAYANHAELVCLRWKLPMETTRAVGQVASSVFAYG